MTFSKRELTDAAARLYCYLLERHWNDHALSGPDSGVRFNARVGRFVKSYLSFVDWQDNMTYLQAQGYWVLDNWLIADLLGNAQARSVALACTTQIQSLQDPEGFWHHPNPEWRGRIQTVEGCFATLGMLATYRRTGDKSLLEAARRWFDFAIEKVGFQEDSAGNGHAINYFSNVTGAVAPNNSTLALATFANLADAVQDAAAECRCARARAGARYLEPCGKMVSWLMHVQLESGELPYGVACTAGVNRPHFLCYQYNAFEFIDLADYLELTDDQTVIPLMRKLAAYLATGVTQSGASRYNCFKEYPEVLYYGVVLAAALSRATRLGLGDYGELAERGFRHALAQQRPEGGFGYFSRRNYRLLSDRRSYPRNLAMILNHLLREVQATNSSADSSVKDRSGGRV